MRAARPSIVSEFDDVELGDERLDARLLLLAEALSREPELSFPDALEDGAELEAGYRFFNNPRVDAAAVLLPHVAASAARLEAVDRALAIHDTTEFVFGGKSARAGLEGDRFRAHFCLAVSADGQREPLGVLAIDPWVRSEVKGKRPLAERRKEDDRESKRWLQQSIAVEAAVSGTALIHVEDREADIYESLSARAQRGMHFIVRAQNYRVVETGEDYTNILEHLRSQPRRFERDVVLSRRQTPTGKSAHQAREGRRTRLAFASATVAIRRPRTDGVDVPESLRVNVVHVVEVDPPEGEQRVEWLLLTTEPIDTIGDVEFVVDSYRARWVIEEYFKALKTGCAYEARQLESYDALLRALSIFAVIAWRLLWMRFLAQHAPSTPATCVATAAELAVLGAQKRIRADATVDDFLRAVAKLGGHIKRNGPPGWQVLWRGYRKLGDLAAGYAARAAEEVEK